MVEDLNLYGEVITYFANWNLGEKPADQGGEVASIPWESVTYVNHAFWRVAPVEDPDVTSFDRRDGGKEARTEFIVESTAPEADYEDTSSSDVVEGLARNHFSEYEYFSEKYPEVNIMISVGGWSDCGYFSEMAYTEEGRASFVNSCVELMEKYSWIDGIDIDWEYPAYPDGDRLPEDESDQGCPVWGTGEEDNANFASLLKLFRETFDEKFGEGTKKLTSCAGASIYWSLPEEDWVSAAPYLDYINVMTYDMCGVWDGVTGFGTSYSSVTDVIEYFTDLGIEASKLNVGTPFYGTVFLMTDIDADNIVGAPVDEDAYLGNDNFTQKELRQFESEAVSGYKTADKEGTLYISEYFDNGGTGWHYFFDEDEFTCYMYNDDENSEYYKVFLSYENELSLQKKLTAIRDYDAAGIIIWESSEDSSDYAMTTYLGDHLISK